MSELYKNYNMIRFGIDRVGFLLPIKRLKSEKIIKNISVLKKNLLEIDDSNNLNSMDSILRIYIIKRLEKKYVEKGFNYNGKTKSIDNSHIRFSFDNIFNKNPFIGIAIFNKGMIKNNIKNLKDTYKYIYPFIESYFETYENDLRLDYIELYLDYIRKNNRLSNYILTNKCSDTLQYREVGDINPTRYLQNSKWDKSDSQKCKFSFVNYNKTEELYSKEKASKRSWYPEIYKDQDKPLYRLELKIYKASFKQYRSKNIFDFSGILNSLLDSIDITEDIKSLFKLMFDATGHVDKDKIEKKQFTYKDKKIDDEIMSAIIKKKALYLSQGYPEEEFETNILNLITRLDLEENESQINKKKKYYKYNIKGTWKD